MTAERRVADEALPRQNETELRVPGQFDRGAYRDEEKSIASAVWLIRYMCRCLGLADLSESDVLDVGCGVKFTQAILNHNLPIRSYVGVDVYADMIRFLQENQLDDRFEYHHIDVRNELYNPDAPAMTVDTDLGVGQRKFDVICLFSVFTHLAPHDYVTMLRLLRRYIRPSGRLFYTLYVDEVTPGGHGLTDAFARRLQDAAASDPHIAAELQRGEYNPPPFVDKDPSRPLNWAVYSREYAHELIVGTGWKPLELFPPNEYAQHQFVCAPRPLD